MSKKIFNQLPTEFQQLKGVQYALEVVCGKVVACEYTLKACKRFFDDLVNGETKGFYLDLAAIQMAIRFFEFFLVFTKGKKAGEPFILEPWQHFIVLNIFGWKNHKTSLRRFREAFVLIARKNGKTELAAGIELLMASIDGERGAEVYSAATKEEQAAIVKKSAKTMIELSPRLRTLGFETFQSQLIFKPTNSIIKALGKNSKTQDGLNPSCYIIDEYHAWDDNALMEVLESGDGAREQPLKVIITTGGFNIEGPCRQYTRNMRQVLDGAIENESVFAILFEADRKKNKKGETVYDAWDKEKTWQKANPGLGTIINLERFRGKVKDIKANPTKLSNFKVKNLNMWLSNVDEEWLSDEIYMKNVGKIDKKNLKKACIAGFDLASVGDLTAVAMVSDVDKEGFRDIHVQFFCPEDVVRKRSREDGVPYDLWIEMGFITVTPGNVTDYSYIKKYIKQKRNKGYNIKLLEFDKWNASQIAGEMADEGFEVNFYSQTIGHLSGPTRELKRGLLQGKFRLNENPVLRWMRGNVVEIKDANGNIKIGKGQSREKVDGWVAIVMGIGGWLTPEEEDDIYDGDGMY